MLKAEPAAVTAAAALLSTISLWSSLWSPTN